ncbi:DUF4328 domain-containing protein [Streptomyces sp. KHY 26]|uniref:DUF4328 domain-containing protein n=1 Tax=Streptomyces sp. KHY 26 TaxID=3097359 RepID=UPI00376F4288
MTAPAPLHVVEAPWIAARCAQVAVVAVVAVDLTRAVSVGSRPRHALPAGAWFTPVLVWGMVLSAAVFLVWFARCRRNAHLLSHGTVNGFSPAWGVLAWLIPVVNLWAPWVLVRDVLRASTPGAGAPARSDALVNAWWAAWVAHTLFAPVCAWYGVGGSLPAEVAAEVLYGAAAVLAVAVIQRVTARQAAGIAAGAVAPAPAGPPRTS